MLRVDERGTAYTQQNRLHFGRSLSSLITPDTHRPSYAIAMVADALVSNRRHAFNHHADVFMFVLRVILHPLNKQCAREVDRGLPPVSFFVIDGFAF